MSAAGSRRVMAPTDWMSDRGRPPAVRSAPQSRGQVARMLRRRGAGRRGPRPYARAARSRTISAALASRHGADRLAGVERHALDAAARVDGGRKHAEAWDGHRLARPVDFADERFLQLLGGVDAGAQHPMRRVRPHLREGLGEHGVLARGGEQAGHVVGMRAGLQGGREARADAPRRRPRRQARRRHRARWRCRRRRSPAR